MRRGWLSGLSLLAALLLCRDARGADGAPSAALDIGVDEKVGEKVPLDLGFVDTDGRRWRLRDYFAGDTPILLVLAYTQCKTLCNVVLHSVSRAISQLEESSPGRDFRALTISIDPSESAHAARAKEQVLAQRIGFDGETWRFPIWRGRAPQVRALADALGFRYAWDPRIEQFAHPAAAFVLRSDGEIVQYLHGVLDGPEVLEAAFARAASAAPAPRAGSLVGAVLRCFRLDPTSRRYGDQLRLYYRAGGLLLLVGMGAFLARLSTRKRRRDDA